MRRREKRNINRGLGGEYKKEKEKEREGRSNDASIIKVFLFSPVVPLPCLTSFWSTLPRKRCTT